MKWNLMDLMQKAYFQGEGRSKIYTDSQVSISMYSCSLGKFHEDTSHEKIQRRD